MATLRGANNTKALSNVPSEKINNGDQHGRVRHIYDSYTLSAALATSDEILMGDKIPAGARVVDFKCVFPDLDAGSGARLDFGWSASAEGGEAADADGFGNSVNVEAAGSYSMFEDQSSRPGQFKLFTEACQAKIVVEAEGGTPATSGTIYTEIAYVVD